MVKKCINPEALFNSVQFGFSQVIVSPPGRMVIISGQVAWDREGEIIGKNDLGTQTKKAFDNLATALRSAGGRPEDVVMIRIYIVDINDEKCRIVGHMLREFFGIVAPPASTWIGVQGLADSDFLIELEAQAILHAPGD